MNSIFFHFLRAAIGTELLLSGKTFAKKIN